MSIEAIAWSKACIGPRQTADAICRALIEYEAELTGGTLKAIERSGPRTRYTATTLEPEQAIKATPRLMAAMKVLAPFEDVYLDWVTHDSSEPETRLEGYPFGAEFDGGPLVRHKLNLIFATCCHADALVARGYPLEAKRLLCEAIMIEPKAEIVMERLRVL